MASYRTIKPKNPSLTTTATDIHIFTYDPEHAEPTDKSPKLNVKGVDLKAPADPGASYQLDGDGTPAVDISSINVGVGGEINIRLECDQDKFPPVWSYWTNKDGRIEKNIENFP
jgi:hypothetical protein